MKQVKKSWIAALVGALLMATLVGVVWARPNGRPEASPAWKVLTVSAADCIPALDGNDWDNWGRFLRCDSGICYFTCPVPLPPETVRVKKFEMYAHDEGPLNITSRLHRPYPLAGNALKMADANSSGSSSGVRTFTDTTIANNPVRPRHGTYVWLKVPTGSYEVYGFRVCYE